MTKPLCTLAILAVTGPGVVQAADGYANINGLTIGGASGPVVIVSNRIDFATYVRTNIPYTVLVEGTIVTNSITPRSNKSIIGIGTNAAFIGRLNISVQASNIVVRNLFISNPGTTTSSDGITIDDSSHHIWVDHCTFSDCGDGQVDITGAADFVTVSWCKFSYVDQSSHRFSNLIGASDTATNDAGKLRVTFHHNWWGTLCTERMPRVRFGRVHVYNNYYNAPGNNYCTAASIQSEVLVEKNFFENVDEPYRYQSPAGLLRAVSNITVNCTGVGVFNDSVFTPPYTYTLDAAADVPGIVTNAAGAGKLGFDGAPFQLWQLNSFGCILCPQAAVDADPDGDGQDNMTEYLAGTDPTNAASTFRVINIENTGDTVTLAWPTAPGRTNIVEAAAEAAGGYSNVSPDIFTTGTSTNFSLTTNAPNLYYRIKILP